MSREVVQKYRSRGFKTLVFCNTVSSCRAVLFSLHEAEEQLGFHALTYHGDLNSQQRKDELEKFRRTKGFSIMVCTDIAARGLDIPEIDHVVLFDFPMNPIDFLHRSGRCGRNNKPGIATSILTRRDLVLASAIQGAIARNQPIDMLTSSKRDYEDRGKLAPVVGKLSRADAIKREKTKKIMLTGKISSSKRLCISHSTHLI